MGKEIHLACLKAYNIIIENIISKNGGKLGDYLFLCGNGLFHFFPYAQLNYISELYTTIQKFIDLDKDELNSCLPGLMSSLILLLDDTCHNNREKCIYQFFDKIQQKLKSKGGAFYGTYWSLLLRNKSLAKQGIKYLNKKITDAKKEDEKKEILLMNEFSINNNLVVNSLSQLFEDEDLKTVIDVLDFVKEGVPLTADNKMINEESKKILIISVLKSLKLSSREEDSARRKVKEWLLGVKNLYNDEIDKNSEDIKYKIGLVVDALKKMFCSEKIINSNDLQSYVHILKFY